ncbi:alpha/beta fold hydrolase [Aestuariirhabdus sp. Z084]|uniref:alpha/beta fold hydrolase n=1 Tax=Aestuariirhabdus haliotis TaxID=2918751 RepID=UPI00201B43BE|nr:alpha/beta hydrolase [Aestuariirhabdus haliotis]MCL6417025.1 alpha/beta fold hydrolase [Aestuariirhabdus haliotis]MCL6421058.1 alpha/beta fold hydrolase [Aestuariirhabdus haliotis]
MEQKAVETRQPVATGYVTSGSLQIYYERRGDPSHPPVLLLMGAGCQLSLWPQPLLQGLLESGFQLVLMDNRDIGLSSRVKAAANPSVATHLVRYLLGLPGKAHYSLHDLVDDCRVLLDHLGLSSVHLLGYSMGGMVAQLLSAAYPERIRSLNLLMSGSNHPRLMSPSWRVIREVLRASQPTDNEGLCQRSFNFWKCIESPGWPADPELLWQQVKSDLQRGYDPDGFERQLLAIFATGSLRSWLCRIKAPTLVLHGTADPLIPCRAGRDSARHIPEARFESIEQMGHDFPPELLPRLHALLFTHLQQVETGQKHPTRG